jgi:LuxR family maltose regulon positive regulatory protein
MTPPPASALLDRTDPAARGGLAAVAPPTPGFAVFESKLRTPALRPGLVSRAGLVNRLRATRTVRLATLVAPAGYGKTTLLAQWAARDERPFVWLSVDGRDNDPLLLVRHLATAFDRVETLDPTVLDALEAPGPSVWEDAAPRLAAAVASHRSPFVAVLDDADAIRRGDSADLVAALAEHVPAGSLLVLVGRSAPALPIARLRASGGLLELGADDLALSRRDSVLLVRATGLELDDEGASDLAVRSEGWAAGLVLATRALDDAGPVQRTVPVGGDDRFLVDYFWSEHLSRLSAERLAFLRRTSVLERLSGELCDAVLEREGSALELAAIARAGLFLVPLDRQGGWYRYHRFFRDALRHELERHDASLAPELHARAADWLEAHGDPEGALGHTRAGGDTARAGRILTTIGLPGACAGPASIERWLDAFAGEVLDAQPAVAALGAWVLALRGRPEDAERWLEHADPAAADAALVRAALCADGPTQMERDAEAALAALAAESPWRPTALVLVGVAKALQDERADADATFAAAAEAAQRRGDADTDALAMAERALLAATAGDQTAAERLALRAREVAAADPVEEHVGRALAHAVAARALLRHGRWDEARHGLEAAEALAGPLSHALPWLAVQVRVELGAAHVTLRNRTAAAAQLAECERILTLRPDLGSLADAVADLRRQLDGLPAAGDGHGTGLTGAELRLLPLLATHLSFREIGERLFVSRNTIKTQAISAYRKLGVSSRSAAIERAAELGLIDAAAGEFIRRG